MSNRSVVRWMWKNDGMLEHGRGAFVRYDDHVAELAEAERQLRALREDIAMGREPRPLHSRLNVVGWGDEYPANADPLDPNDPDGLPVKP